jgi:DNA-binding protein HU-beta
MNRAELIDEIVKITGQSKTQVSHCISGMIHCITGSIASGKKVTLVGFGTFERRNRAARTGVNPQNPSQKLKIAAAKVPAFRAGRELKAVVDGRERLSMPTVLHGSPSKSSKSVSKKKGGSMKKSGGKKRR